MILDKQDNVKGLSWSVDLLCARVDVLEAENMTLREEVQVLCGWDKEFAASVRVVMPAYLLILWRTSRFDYREVGVAKRGRSGR